MGLHEPPPLGATALPAGTYQGEVVVVRPRQTLGLEVKALSPEILQQHSLYYPVSFFKSFIRLV